MNIRLDASIKGSWKPLTQRSFDRIDMAVRKVAFNVQADAQDRCPLITGSLKNSIHTVTSRGSGYQQAAEAAAAATAAVGQKARPMFPPLPLPPKGQAIVAVGMEYGFDVEYGAARKPKPYLTPATERMRPMLEAAVSRAMELG